MPVLNDGNIPYGAPDAVTIGAETYMPESVTFEEGSNLIIRRNNINARSGQVIQPDGVTGSAVLQLAEVDTPIPEVGNTFDVPWRGVSITVAITKVGEVQAQDQIHKISVDLVKRINAP